MSRGEEVGGPRMGQRTCLFPTSGLGFRRVDARTGAYTRSIARTTITEAVVLRSFPYGEADRVLHVYTAASGRIGAMAKGVRRTKSRFGGRLEPFSHVEVGLHRGRGELATVTGASLVRSHDRIRSDGYRLQVGLVGLEAMLRLFTEEERNDRAFLALTWFLDALDEREPQPGRRTALDPVVLSFQLKLLWLSGFLPHVTSCVECGAEERLVAFDASAGGAVCAACDRGMVELSPEGLHGLTALLGSPIADAPELLLGERALRDALSVVTTSYEHHGGFRLRTLA
jgi:DNA repair protein RecO (recombination protein O)